MKKIISIILCTAILLFSTGIAYAASLDYAIKPQFDGAGNFSEGLACVNKDGKWGYIDANGKLVIPYKYDEAFNFYKGRAIVRKGDKWTTVDKDGKELAPYIQADYFYTVDNGVYNGTQVSIMRFKRGEKMGLVDLYCREITPPVYDHIQWLGEGLVSVYKRNTDKSKANGALDLKGYVDPITGKEVVPCGLYDDAFDFSDGLAVVVKDDQYACIDETGKIVIPFGKYGSIGTFKEGMAQVRKDHKYGIIGFINLKGELVIPYQYEFAWFFNDGLAMVKKNGKYGFIDRNGKEVIPCEYEDVGREGMFMNDITLLGNGEEDSIVMLSDEPNSTDYIVMSNKKYGYANREGELITPCIYDYAEDFVNGFGKVAKGGNGGAGNYYEGGKFGFVDTSGKEVVPCKYDYVGNFVSRLRNGVVEGVAPVSIGGSGRIDDYKGGKWGYVDAQGKEITPLIYDRTYEFVGGLGRVVKNGKYGFVDTTGKEVIPCIYDLANDFNNGAASVVKNGKGGMVDSYGNEIVNCIYDNIRPFVNDKALVKYNGKIGYLGRKLDSPAPVQASLAPGKYKGPQTISLSCSTEDAEIYYIIKDNRNTLYVEPTQPYLKPITIYKTTSITAFAVKKGMKYGSQTVFKYEIEQQNVMPVEADLIPGSYSSEQNVSLKCPTEGAVIYYTTDGTIPTVRSTEYTRPIKVSKPTVIKAMAVKDGMIPSEAVTFTYDIK